MTFLRKLVTYRPGFMRELYALVFPIAIQNLILTAVAMADVVMLGRVSQTALSAASLAGQVQFLLNMLFFGLTSALGILAAQYWGKGDCRTLGQILGIGLYIGLGAGLLLGVAGLVCPEAVMRIWTNDPELVRVGAQYLRLVAVSYLFQGISQPYTALIKNIERVRFTTLVSVLTLGFNVFLNAVLIFGLFGAPAMGIRGAALATSMARGLELLIYFVDFRRQKILPVRLAAIFLVPRTLVRDFIHYSLPALINDVLWSLAFNVNSMIMGRLGTDMVAANSVVTVARELVTTVGFAISGGASILLGIEIGENKIGQARDDAGSILKVTFLICVAAGLILLAASPFIPGFVKISPQAASYLKVMIYISCVYQMGQVVNTVLIVSVFRCGGESRYGMILDLCVMWLWLVPVSLLAAFVLKLPPLWVYTVMCTDEWVKMPFAVRHYRGGTWARNITREHQDVKSR